MRSLLSHPALAGWAIAAAAIAVPIAGAATPSDIGPPRWAANVARKQFVILNGVPRPYAAIRDRSPDTPLKLYRGQVIFEQQCSACHGCSGHGGGSEAFALVPAPADLDWLMRTPKDRSAPYLYWVIAEGGDPFDSDMPAFKNRLSRKEIEAVSAYIRAGLPRKSP